MNIKTTWDLTPLYSSPKDPAIIADTVRIEEVCDAFAKKWAKKELRTVDEVLALLRAYKKLEEAIGGYTPVHYLGLVRDTHSDDPSIQALLTKLSERITLATNKILFFELSLGKIAVQLQKEILKDTRAKEFQHMLLRIFAQAKHRIGEEGEKILSLKSSPAYSLWVEGSEKLISSKSVVWKKEIIPINKAVGMVASLPHAKDRQALHAKIIEQLKTCAFFATEELNAVCVNKKQDDMLRGFTHPYSATLLDYENDEQSIVGMLGAARDSYKVAHRLYALKAKILEVSKLHYTDLNVTLAKKRVTYSYEDAIAIIERAFAKIGPEFKEIFDRFVQNGQIDVYARVGKRGGGYCAPRYNCPTYILLNWSDELHSVMTLAHEMGHAIHSEFAKSQGVLYEDYPISLAEIASTLFEKFVFEELVADMDEEERFYARFNKMQDTVSTIFRQIAYFDFEQGMHATVAEKGRIEESELTVLMQKNLQAYMGKSAIVNHDDGYLWVRYAHARWFFYVYSYAYGELISNALFAEYKKDRTFIEKIKLFLSSGGSMSPDKLFKSIGLDTTKQEFWNIGISALEREITELEKEYKKIVRK